MPTSSTPSEPETAPALIKAWAIWLKNLLKEANGKTPLLCGWATLVVPPRSTKTAAVTIGHDAGPLLSVVAPSRAARLMAQPAPMVWTSKTSLAPLVISSQPFTRALDLIQLPKFAITLADLWPLLMASLSKALFNRKSFIFKKKSPVLLGSSFISYTRLFSSISPIFV